MFGNEDQGHTIRSMIGHSGTSDTTIHFITKLRCEERIFTLRNMKHIVHLNPWDRVAWL
jgi:hypothetical protein